VKTGFGNPMMKKIHGVSVMSQQNKPPNHQLQPIRTAELCVMPLLRKIFQGGLMIRLPEIWEIIQNRMNRGR